MAAKVTVLCISIFIIAGFLLPDTFAEPEYSHKIHDSAISQTVHWIALAVLVLALGVICGFRKDAFRFMISTLSVGAGIVHLLLAPEHYSNVGFEHGIFFLGLGSYQILFGFLFLKDSRQLSKITIAVVATSIVLYAITRLDTVEPLIAPEGIDPIGILTKIIEGSLLSSLIIHLRYRKKIVVSH